MAKISPFHSSISGSVHMTIRIVSKKTTLKAKIANWVLVENRFIVDVVSCRKEKS